MSKDEIETLIRKIGGLFPNQITVEQSKFLRKELGAFDHECANRALHEHRSSREFFNFPQFIEGCRAAERAATEKTVNGEKEGTWFDVQRRFNPQLTNACDLEVALRVFRQHLHKSSGNEGYRRKFLSECRVMVIAAGVEVQHADSWAETILQEPATFAWTLQELRGGLPTQQQAAEPETAGV